MEVLFEGADTNIYNDVIDDSFNLDIKEDFAYLFVGHWLKGDTGQDRKDVGMLIKTFVETFNLTLDHAEYIVQRIKQFADNKQLEEAA
jgi:hypothetical protein